MQKFKSNVKSLGREISIEGQFNHIINAKTVAYTYGKWHNIEHGLTFTFSYVKSMLSQKFTKIKN